MKSGARLLREWIRRRRLKQNETADLLGVCEAEVSNLVNGKRPPSLPKAVLIEKLTGVPVEAWVSSRRNKRQTVAEYAAQNAQY